ncbi:uncharacterized protein LOC114540365 [Dendronephthya gigantea]|uniref:uncharacterized protein LOC114530766 n=1 Tax=Dendronephthya gigantea TaxID=151771 RepID=UPI00106B0497|nr:uncharacterized protein LOC114530766 [Dendronephthya gigantea]XP_028416017.1 uncharacterized protein LOC114539574 [Dendronephthya gigantea]XP_028416361.1 uncharacterized protein LOC114540365 [Dendronephthya gigantea]
MSDISHEKFAEPMLEGEQFLQGYIDTLKELLRDGTIPDLKEKNEFQVYSIKGSGFGSHKSIVLSPDGKRFFSVELGFITVDGEKRIYPVTRKIPSDIKDKLVPLGKIEATSGDLISKAVAIMKKFGSYFKWTNNCHDYCNLYLEEIGLKKAQTLTDGDKGSSIQSGGSGAGGAGGALSTTHDVIDS